MRSGATAQLEAKHAIESQGSDTGWRGFGRLAGLLAALTLLGFAGVFRASGAEAAPRITVRVYNYAPAAQERLAGAQKEAHRILGKAGVEVDWLECHVSPAAGAKPPGCQELLGPAGLALRILPGVKPLWPGFRARLGFAVVRDDRGLSAYGSIFYDRVEEIAVQGPYPLAVILGIVMAHEIGHLLLCTNSHGRRGIMRACWEQEDLRNAARRYLPFAPQEAARMRAEVSARARLQEETRIHPPLGGFAQRRAVSDESSARPQKAM